MKPRRSALAANHSARSVPRWPLALVALGLVLGCAYGTLPPRIVKGQDFSVEVAQTIEAGDSADEVLAALGEPLSIEEKEDADLWRYYARERKDGVTYILGFIPKRTPHFIWDYELRLTVRNGEVQEADYTTTKIK